MARHFGQAVKGASLRVGDQTERGEFVISQRGLEGGGIYAVSRALRLGGALEIDLMPEVPRAEITAKLASMKRGESRVNRLRKLGLAPQSVALVQEFARDAPIEDAVKHLSPRLIGPRPLDEAISVAGGITAQSLTADLELRAIPNLFACGEMLDWEAPTGGYLLTAAWATGQWAGRAAARRLAN
jgi:predicted flavoprotein YhiN